MKPIQSFLRNSSLLICCVLFTLACKETTTENTSSPGAVVQSYSSNSYEDLTALFSAWRTFEQPPLLNGAPDYRVATFEARNPDFEALRGRLKAIDTSGWSVQNKVDWMIVWAEMNGYQFNRDILKPWERDPAFRLLEVASCHAS